MDITIQYTFLPHTDPEASLGFYRDVLGFEVRNDVGYEGMRWITVGPSGQPGTSVVLYPPTADNPKGKLRLLYEANPIAFLVEQAGGIATDGKGRVLDVMPTAIHQRTPLIVGGQVEMREFLRFVRPEL